MKEDDKALVEEIYQDGLGVFGDEEKAIEFAKLMVAIIRKRELKIKDEGGLNGAGKV